MNEITTLASLIKTQEAKQNEFLKRLDSYKTTVDTTQLKLLLDQYRYLLDKAVSVKPNIDTTNVESIILNSINDAISASRLSDLQYEVTRQTETVNKNNSLLQLGFGIMFEWWILLLILFFGIFIGWAINWCFAIPDRITKIETMQMKMNAYDNALDQAEYYAKFVNSSPQTRSDFAKFNNIKINRNDYLQSPKEYINKELK